MANAGNRGTLYKTLHQDLKGQRDVNAYSARVILDIARDYFHIKSLLDVGCGVGTWLAIAQDFGATVEGIEGPWCEIDKLEVDKDLVTITDLEKPIDLGRKFDVSISLEVGEHLSEAAAPHLVKTLITHADHVIFSAAVPFQGGTHHVNERFLGYWIELFEGHGFIPIDIFRGHLWNDDHVHWWLAQNAVLFANPAVVDTNPKLKAESLVKRPIDVISPVLYFERVIQAKNETHALQQALLQSGKARLRETAEGVYFELT